MKVHKKSWGDSVSEKEFEVIDQGDQKIIGYYDGQPAVALEDSQTGNFWLQSTPDPGTRKVFFHNGKHVVYELSWKTYKWKLANPTVKELTGSIVSD